MGKFLMETTEKTVYLLLISFEIKWNEFENTIHIAILLLNVVKIVVYKF